MILSCEKNTVKKIDIDCILNKWSSAKERRFSIEIIHTIYYCYLVYYNL